MNKRNLFKKGIYPYKECINARQDLDPLQGCSDCDGVGRHDSVPNEKFWEAKQEKKMNVNKLFDGKKLMSRFFRPVDNVVWDLMTGRIGVTGPDGITTVEGEGDDAQVTINLFDQFGMTVPAFAQGTPTADVKIGDLIYGTRGALGWVVDRTEKSFSLLKPDGTRSNWTPPKTAMLGFGGDVMVLRSLLNILPGGETGLGSFQNMLLPMMMMGGDNVDMQEIMPLMLMTQLGATAPTGDGSEAANPMAGMTQMLPMMLMMNMFKGKKGHSGSNWFDGE